MNIKEAPQDVHIHYIKSPSTQGEVAVSKIKSKGARKKNNPIVFFHGATVPCQFTVEYRMDGLSWADYAAQEGWQVYGIDLPGYGRSSAYPSSTDGNIDPRKFGSAEYVQRDIHAALSWILEDSGAEKVHIIAISRGSIPAGYYVANHSSIVKSLTLHAPITPKDEVDPDLIEALIGQRSIPEQENFYLSAHDRFRLLEEDRPAGKKTSLEPYFSKNWPYDYARALSDATQEDVRDAPIATPIGFVVDIFDAWHGKYFSVENITVPFLLLRGEWDHVLTPAPETQRLYDAIGSKRKYYIQFPQATHSILFERGRHEMYRTVDDFCSRFN